jgi:hypothetical protein
VNATKGFLKNTQNSPYFERKNPEIPDLDNVFLKVVGIRWDSQKH